MGLRPHPAGAVSRRCAARGALDPAELHGVTGTFGANLNTEIIQEQQVLTGGIPAEYVGAPGLLSSVITKSGTNQFTGSVNYFFQNDGLVAEDQNASDQGFSRFDTAVTGGGPIVPDAAWWTPPSIVRSRAMSPSSGTASLSTSYGWLPSGPSP